MTPALDSAPDEGSLVLEQRLAVVPEWVIDLDVSDAPAVVTQDQTPPASPASVVAGVDVEGLAAECRAVRVELALATSRWTAASVGAAVGQAVAGLEAQLLEADGRRVWAQPTARQQLAARGDAVTRLSVARLAVRLLVTEVEDVA